MSPNALAPIYGFKQRLVLHYTRLALYHFVFSLLYDCFHTSIFYRRRSHYHIQPNHIISHQKTIMTYEFHRFIVIYHNRAYILFLGCIDKFRIRLQNYQTEPKISLLLTDCDVNIGNNTRKITYDKLKFIFGFIWLSVSEFKHSRSVDRRKIQNIGHI